MCQDYIQFNVSFKSYKIKVKIVIQEKNSKVATFIDVSLYETFVINSHY